MATKQITLGQVLLPENEQLWECVRSAVVASAGVISLKASLESQYGPATWAATLHNMEQVLRKLLDVPILDVIVEAWTKYQDVSNRMDQSRAHPDDIILVPPLAHYTIKSVYRPYIEVTVDHLAVAKIEFEVSVTLKLEGVVLKIQNSRIMEIQTGSCQGTLKLALQKAVLAEVDTGSIPLPGSIPLQKQPAVALPAG